MKDIIIHIPISEEICKVIQDAIKKGFETQGKSNQVPSNQEIQYLTRKDIAEGLKITLPTLRAWTKSGKIKAYRIGRRILYDPVEVRQSLIEQKIIVRK